MWQLMKDSDSVLIFRWWLELPKSSLASERQTGFLAHYSAILSGAQGKTSGNSSSFNGPTTRVAVGLKARTRGAHRNRV